eukprot:jgi/Picsp_1/1111/NSC_04593-R2_---NA---
MHPFPNVQTFLRRNLPNLCQGCISTDTSKSIAGICTSRLSFHIRPLFAAGEATLKKDRPPRAGI